jgi:lysyl-tRNA synthetase class 1
MFWADELVKARKEKEWVNDAWTPSGIIHMGGIKGPIIHDVLFKIIKEQGREATCTFGFDDMDPIDGLPKELLKTHEQYLGIPICNAPSPDGKGSFGDYYASLMRDLFKTLGVEAKIYLAHEYYRSGTYNKAVEFLLNHAADVRKVYADMYKKEIADSWFPLQVICPACGKLGTTKVTGWDGKEVDFICEPQLVTWAKGCGETGKISPFDGNGKLPWKVEWAAKWWTFGVTIEGAGKDHASAGGSYDIAHKICKEVFKQEPPLAIPYEFFLWGGKKMSSSKGIGLTAQELLEVIPPQMARFLMIKTRPNQAVEFNPYQTQIIPKLYDDYQKSAEMYESKSDDELARAFELSQVGETKIPPRIRFLTLVQWVQMPNMENEIKKQGLEEWAKYARVWIEKYAPESDRFTIRKEMPKEAINLSDAQKKLLQKISSEVEKYSDPEVFQKDIYEWAKELEVQSKDAFSAIYKSLIGKDHGPKAGWLILSLDKEFVKKRFDELAS